MVWIVLILAPSITDLQNNSLNTGLKRLLVFKILLLLSQLSVLNINNSFMTLLSWLNQHALVILFKYSINLSYLLHLKNKRLFNLSLPCTSSFSLYHSIDLPYILGPFFILFNSLKNVLLNMIVVNFKS